MAVIMVIGCLGNEIFGQKMTAMRNVAKGGYNFWIYEPGEESDNGNAKPLVIFLHGASLKGTDMKRVLKYGPLNAANRGVKIDAFVVAPQTANNWEADKIWKCVEWVKDHYNVDTNRISVIGMSLGGFGTFTLATKYNDKLAAGMMLCGGNTNENYCELTHMPFWIMHGTADRAVPIARSNSIVSNMVMCGDTSRLIYTRLQGADHGYPAKLFYLTETYDWLTSHSLTDKDRAVNRNININKEMISGAYGRLSGLSGTVKIVTSPSTQPDNAASGEGEGQKQAQEQAPVQTSEGESATTPDDKTTSATSEKKQATVQSEANPEYHVVVAGNTLYGIARKYHTTVQKLCELNGISENSILQLGQKIKLPKNK